MNNRISIEKADAKQLRWHCENVLGLELPPVANTQQLVAKIRAVTPDVTEIFIGNEQPSPAQEEAVILAGVNAEIAEADHQEKAVELADVLKGMSERQAAQHHYDPKIELMVNPTPEPGGDRDVPVAVNGVQFAFPRGKFVTVPYRIYEAVVHALETKYAPKLDLMGRLESMEPRYVPSYPYSTQNGPSEAEIAAWRERTDNVELA